VGRASVEGGLEQGRDVSRLDGELDDTHAYTLHWNDGVNQVQISVKDASPPDAPTVEQLAAKVPRARIEKLAQDLFVAIEPYIHGK